MPLNSAREIDQALGDLPLMDRVVALIASIVTRKDAAKAVIHMIAIITVMARHLGEAERIAVAEILRDSADAVERRELERV